MKGSCVVDNQMRPIPPGEILLEEFIRPLQLNIKSFALLLNLTEAELLSFLHGRMKLTEQLAKDLARWLGNSEQFWWNLQDTYDRRLHERTHF